MAIIKTPAAVDSPYTIIDTAPAVLRASADGATVLANLAAATTATSTSTSTSTTTTASTADVSYYATGVEGIAGLANQGRVFDGANVYVTLEQQNFTTTNRVDNPAGDTGEVQFNNGGVLGSSANLAFDGANLLTGGIKTDNYYYANGSPFSGGGGSSYGNANVVALLSAFGSNTLFTTGNVTSGNLLTGGLISTTGNVVGNNIIGAAANIPSVVSQNLDVENISARGSAGVNIGAGGFNNLVVEQAQVLIQNVPLSVSGNVIGGNIRTGGLISATGNITSGNVNTGVITLTNGAVIKDNAGDSVAFGQSAGGTSQGNSAVALGQNAGATGQGTFAVAIGRNAGQTTQGGTAIAIGAAAGDTSQGNSAVAIGSSAGLSSQSANTVAIGTTAGSSTQGVDAVAIGNAAGSLTQGISAVAIGNNAGQTTQGINAIAIGASAGFLTQGNSAVAIGQTAGNSAQGEYSAAFGYGAGANAQGLQAVAIGSNAGAESQRNTAVAIGAGAGFDNQGNSAVAIGYFAGQSAQGNNSIIINATGAALNALTANTFTVAPVRNDVANIAEVVFYNTTTKEITYGNTVSVAGNITGGNLTVGSGTITGGNVNGSNFNGNVAFGTGTVGGSGNITGGNILTAGLISATGNITGNYFIGNGSQLTSIAVPSQTILPTIQSISIAATSNPFALAGGQGGANVTVANTIPVIEYGVIITDGTSSQKYATGALGSIPGTVALTFTTGVNNLPFTVFAYVTSNAGTFYSNSATGTSGICLLAGTQIALSDGTHKAIEDITYTDKLLSWDFDRGCYAETTALWIKRSETGSQYNLLTFSDGTTLRTFDQHRIFNKQAGSFTYPMTAATPIGTVTVNEHGQEIILTNKQVIQDTIEYYNVITDYHMNLFSDSVLTSCRFNNIYPITDMKFAKDGRTLRTRAEFENVPDRFFHGLRLAEQTTDIETVEWYVNRLLSTEASSHAELAV